MTEVPVEFDDGVFSSFRFRIFMGLLFGSALCFRWASLGDVGLLYQPFDPLLDPLDSLDLERPPRLLVLFGYRPDASGKNG